MTKIDFSHILDLYPMFLAHSSQNPLNFLSNESRQLTIWNSFLLSYLVSCPQFLKSLQSHKGEVNVLFMKSTFPPQLGLCSWENLWKAPKDWSWLPGEPTTNKELELSVPPHRGESLKVQSITNSQWFHQSCLCNQLSIKTHKEGFQRDSRWTYGEFITYGAPKRTWSSVSIPYTLPNASLPSGSTWVTSFYKKLII